MTQAGICVLGNTRKYILHITGTWEVTTEFLEIITTMRKISQTVLSKCTDIKKKSLNKPLSRNGLRRFAFLTEVNSY